MDDVVRQILERKHGLKVGRRLGRGGLAEVYRAESAQGVPCALKISFERLHQDQPAVQKELENLSLVQKVSGHPHVVTLMDYWLVDGYLVTRWELSTEGSLAEILAQHQAAGQPGIPLKQLWKYLLDAAQGIDFLNRQGIYHRDIKPHNLLLFHGRVKLADLGLAKFAGASTASHTGSGTLGYLSPEAYDEHRLSQTVDLYSLAATYVKLRTGQEPFGTSPLEIAQRQKEGRPLTDGLPPKEADWVRRALASRPEDRPQEGAVKWLRGHPLARPADLPLQRTASPTQGTALDPAVSMRRHDGTALITAVTNAAPAAELELAAGTYRLWEPLRIDKPLTLRGPGRDTCIIQCDAEGSVIEFTGSGRLNLHGVTVQHIGQLWANGLVVHDGEFHITNCRFTGAVWDEAHNCGGSGLWLRGTARGVIQNCEFTGNGLHGIEVAGQARPELIANRCEDNKYSGILYSGSAAGIARENTCTGNGLHGIGILGQARPELIANRCENNKQDGIRYSESAAGGAKQNTCTGNGLHGIEVSGQARPELIANRCENNQKCGIAYFESAAGIARVNTCTGNGAFGIAIEGNGQPKLQANIFKDNRLSDLKQGTCQTQNANDGSSVGASWGAILGAIEGVILGAILWAMMGAIVGATYGAMMGASEGKIDGHIEVAMIVAMMGAIVGATYGAIWGASKGTSVRAFFGAMVGWATRGANEGANRGSQASAEERTHMRSLGKQAK